MGQSRQKTVEDIGLRSKALRPGLWTSIVIHWFAQAMFHMDPTERLLKVASSFAGGMLLWVVLDYGWFGLVFSLAIAHTANFLLNGQLNVVLKNYGISRTNEDGLLRYLNGLRSRLATAESIRFGAVYGSLARGQLRRTSDLDIRLVRRPGLAPACRGFVFVAGERLRAALIGVPLDILMLDSERGLRSIRSEEVENAEILKQNQQVKDYRF